MKNLTIYIPSYNRGESLKRQLQTISANRHQNRIKVIVRDNCSTAEEYANGDIKRLCEENGFFYERNICNIGGNPNIIAGFMDCKQGEYLWILSDDDSIHENAIDKILETIDEAEPDIFFFTHEKYENGCLVDFSLDLINNGLGLISLVVYKTDFIIDNIRAGYDNILSSFPHMAVLLESIKNNNGKVRIFAVNKTDYFMKDDDPVIHPEGVKGYRNSLYGYLLLVYNLEEKYQKTFVRSWWNDTYNKFAAAKYRKQNIIQIPIWMDIMSRYIVLFKLRFMAVKLLLPFVEIARKHLRSGHSL